MLPLQSQKRKSSDMTATWILILHIVTYNGAGATSAEFYTKERCEAAGKQAEENFSGYMKATTWICVEK